MTTPLRKPLARELMLDDVPFKVVVSPEGVRIMRKGRRRSAAVSWDTILRLTEATQNEQPPPVPSDTELPKPVAAEVASEIAAGIAALTKAGEKLTKAKDLPPELRRQMNPDPVDGPAERRSDWFIEPLLTPPEVASVLRVSVSAVSRLPIRWISIAGERRYRQSEIRRYLEGEERDNTYSRW